MIETIGAFVVQQIAGYAINKGLDHVFKKDEVAYQQKLASVIDKTIDDYISNYPIAEKAGKFHSTNLKSSLMNCCNTGFSKTMIVY